MTIAEYIQIVNQRFLAGNATEHSYRGDLQNLLQTLLPNVDITNEPKRIDCGAPDYIISRKGKDIPIGYIEAKDVGVELGAKAHKAQFDRYRAALDNLIITDYLQFHFYKQGQLVASCVIGELSNGKVFANPHQFDEFTHLIQNFALVLTQSIKSPTKLAGMMASKARLMANVLLQALNEDDANDAKSELQAQREAFKSILIHDIDNAQFADIYAQTIAYGLFAARYHDPTLPTFSREEAATLIPKSNPFLRKLFQTVATYSLDDNVGERLLWIVEELVQVFLATDVAKIMQDFGKSTRQQDPIVHFYETFLAEYDPKLRKARGVWYTPEPVVNFIVRAVDDILKTKFNLPQGLADNSKVTREIESVEPGSKGKAVKKPQTFHRVQILDPATGTGTFLAKTVEHIYQNHFANMQGMWPAYVKEHLIPRLNGFELLMTSYAMAHLKLDMLLTQTGYQSENNNERFHIYLTNSLEEHHPDTGTLFASWLSSEANEANHIKRDAPVMVVIGNPPYSGESANKGEWIMDLMEDYKKEPGGKVKLQERNPKWVNDDYVKFMRFGQHFIEKNGEGILAFINPHGFLDNPTFRGMRWSLLVAYDEIYVLDLHGNSKKKETAQDGSADINVFDIMQGVSINLLIKTGRKKTGELAQVYHCDLYGKREAKYDYLLNNSIKTVSYVKIENLAPNYYFVQKDFGRQKKYDSGFSLNELFPVNSVGIVTSRDAFVIDSSREALKNRIEDFFKLSPQEAKSKYSLTENSSWKIGTVQNKSRQFNESSITKVYYRPFDSKYIYYNNDFIERSRSGVMQHIFNRQNIGIVFSRTVVGSYEWCDIQISSSIIEFGVMATRVGNGAPFAPLYTYPDSTDLLAETTRTPNLNMQIVNTIAQGLGLRFVPEKATTPSLRATPSEEGEFKPTEFIPLQSEGVASRSDDGVVKTVNKLNDLPYNPALKERARELRKAGNLSEVLLWNTVKNKQLNGFDFDRQRVIGNYIVDFYCHECALVIEIDGSSHDDKQEYDAKRDAFLKGLGLNVLHVQDVEIKKNLAGVIELVKLNTTTPSLRATPSEEGELKTFAPIDLLDYIYAVLHSPSYRETYKEFLKIDFPRVPYPNNAETFWELVALGGALRKTHLLETTEPSPLAPLPKCEGNQISYPVAGNHVVGKLRYEDNKVYINESQYFDHVPALAWNFYIGGYQPAQKWLKDRKGRALTLEDIQHYQKIIYALCETDRLMQAVDRVLEF